MKVYVTVKAGEIISNDTSTYEVDTVKETMDIVNLWRDSLMELSHKGATVRLLAVDQLYYVEIQNVGPLPIQMMVYVSLEG